MEFWEVEIFHCLNHSHYRSNQCGSRILKQHLVCYAVLSLHLFYVDIIADVAVVFFALIALHIRYLLNCYVHLFVHNDDRILYTTGSATLYEWFEEEISNMWTMFKYVAQDRGIWKGTDQFEVVSVNNSKFKSLYPCWAA